MSTFNLTMTLAILFSLATMEIGFFIGYIVGVWKGFNIRESNKDKPC